jgi:membrane protein implicated in regulation of membrane protease activity
MVAFFHEKPSRVWLGIPWILGGILLGTLAGWLLISATGLTHTKALVLAGGGLAGAILGIFIAAQLHTAQLRPYLRRVLTEREQEIKKGFSEHGSLHANGTKHSGT